MHSSTVAQICRELTRWPLVLIASFALAGCLGGKSDDQAPAFIGGGAPSTGAPSTGAPSTEVPAPEPVNHAPEISGIPAATIQVGQTYTFTPVASDEDDDFLEFEITNRPAWAQFDVETGVLTGTPGSQHVGQSGDITISVTDGRELRSIGPFRITVTAAPPPPASNTPPTITGTPATVADVGVLYQFAPEALDADGDTLTFSISNRPAWTTFNSRTGQLSGTPAAGNVGTYSNIQISVNDGKATTLLPTFAIQVRGPANQPPRITGTPSTSVQAGQQYSFQPVGSDPDGDTLTYSITNRPTWATFSNTTGRLSGTPSASNVGTYSNIVIRVSDGRETAALAAFSIVVSAAPAPAPTPPANRAPTISGTPATTATVGQAYSFQPSASDADGDTLAWSIQNAPSWATFNTATGRLSGTPTAAGTASNIIIRVSDGTASASLPAFSIAVAAAPTPPPPTSPAPPVTGSATVSWQAPTQNTDGSGLTNLAGYRIVYGTNQNSLDRTVTISNTGTTTYVIEGLTEGTWYFAVRAFNAAGTESANSSIASKTIR